MTPIAATKCAVFILGSKAADAEIESLAVCLRNLSISTQRDLLDHYVEYANVPGATDEIPQANTLTKTGDLVPHPLPKRQNGLTKNYTMAAPVLQWMRARPNRPLAFREIANAFDKTPRSTVSAILCELVTRKVVERIGRGFFKTVP